MNIRTKWHQLLECIAADEVYLLSPPGGKGLHWGEFNPKREQFFALLNDFKKLPKFVIDPELVAMVSKAEARKSLFDMQKAGVLRLPFPAMVVEIPYAMHYLTVLADCELLKETDASWRKLYEDAEISRGFLAYGMGVCKDQEGIYAVIGTATQEMDISFIDTIGGGPMISYQGFTNIAFPASDKLEQYIRSVHQKELGNNFTAFCAAMLLMATAGMKREIIECEPLNKKRVATGKPAIPRHTYITIGHVYRSAKDGSKSDEYMPRKSPLPHWRRGHVKNVLFGKGRTQVKQVYIKPMLVAYAGDADPTQPVYHVKP